MKSQGTVADGEERGDCDDRRQEERRGAGIDLDDIKETGDLAAKLPGEIPAQRPGRAHQQQRQHRKERDSAGDEINPDG